MTTRDQIRRLARAVLLSLTAASLGVGTFLAQPATAQPTVGDADDIGVMFNCADYTNQQMSRANVLMRAQSWIDARVPYSQTACRANQYGNYRTDCSGYVSMAWGLSRSYSTRDIHLVSHEIGWDQLRPGDAMNWYDHHVALFVGWANAAHTAITVVEQAGPDGSPTSYSTWDRARAAGQGYVPIRYDFIVEDALPADRTEGDVTGDGFADLTTIEASGHLAVFGNGLKLPEHGGKPYLNRSWRTANANWADHAESITTADVTGDRFADLIALTKTGKLEIYGNASKLGDGSPFTGAYRTYDNWGGFTNVAAGDVNKDGWADLAATSTDGKLHIFLNTKETGGNALPFRGAAWIYASGWGGDVLDIALGDVTGDAYADLMATRADGKLQLFGNGLLQPAFGGKPFHTLSWQVGSGWNTIFDITVSQVTEDGDADLTAVTTSGELQVYKNTGDPAKPFVNAAWRYPGWTGVKHVA